jgi:hypothetical protein
MNLLGAQIREVPEGLRSLINIGSFIKDVIDNADNNARARVNAGERPDLLEDLLKGAHVHVPKLQEIVEDIAGRTHAKTMADFMMQTHNVIGLFNTLLEKAEDIDAARPGPTRAAPHSPPSQGAANQQPGATGYKPRFRPEFTVDADPNAKRAAEQGTHSVELPIDAGSPAAVTPKRAPQATDKPPHKPAISAFKMDVARHLLAFEEAVAAEQAEIRRGIIAADGEAARLRCELRLLETAWERSASAGGAAVADDTPGTDQAPPASAADSGQSGDDGEEVAATIADGDDADADAEIPEEEAAAIMDMICASQQRVRDSLAKDRAMVEKVGKDLSDLSQQITRLQAPS